MSFKTIVREAVERLDVGGMGAVDSTLTALKEAGAIRDIHVGKKDMTPDQVVEWYAGQILSVLEDKQYFAINSLINCVDKFAPADENEGS